MLFTKETLHNTPRFFLLTKVLYYEEDASVVVGADDFSIYYATKLFNL
jgi:hypothetical protein